MFGKRIALAWVLVVGALSTVVWGQSPASPSVVPSWLWTKGRSDSNPPAHQPAAPQPTQASRQPIQPPGHPAAPPTTTPAHSLTTTQPTIQQPIRFMAHQEEAPRRVDRVYQQFGPRQPQSRQGQPFNGPVLASAQGDVGGATAAPGEGSAIINPGAGVPGVFGPGTIGPVLGNPGVAGPGVGPGEVIMEEGGAGLGGVTPVVVGEPVVGDPVFYEPGLFGWQRFWGRAEALLWWLEGMDSPALATSSVPGTAQADAGILGRGTTSTLFGGDVQDASVHLAGRYTLGYCFDPAGVHCLQATYAWLGEVDDRFTASGANFSILARPFFNVQTGLEDARLINFPGVVGGSLTIDTSTSMHNFELLYRRIIGGTFNTRLDLLMGYRFASLDDALVIDESTTSLTGATAGTTFRLIDRFETQNSIHAFEVGTIFHWYPLPYRNVLIELTNKLAVGRVWSQATLSGQTTTDTPTAAPTTTNSGLLVQGSNRGTFENDEIGYMMEIGLTLRWMLSSRVDLTFGYSLLEWSEVARAADYVDRNINTSQIPPGTLTGAPLPLVPFFPTDLWAQGLHLGLTCRF